MTQGGQTTAFTYDADGRRVMRETVTDTIVYVGSHYEARFEEQDMPEDLDGDCLITIVDIMLVAARWGMTEADPDWDPRYDFDGDGSITVADIMRVAAHWRETCEQLVETVKYYTLGGRRVAMRKVPADPPGQVGTVYYLFSDHLGSTSVAYNTTNGQAQTIRYYPYGSTRSGEVPTDRRFTGQRFDDTIGLYDYNACYYDPLLGRFVQPDPIVPEPGNSQALNRYSYVLNNPLRYTDPTGHAECVDEECNWVVHPVSREVIQRRPTNSPPESPQAYSPAESYQEAMGLLNEFRSNMGPFEREFGPTSSLTQDIMYSAGIQEFHRVWAEAGYPDTFTWHHHIDVWEGGSYPVRFVKSMPGYIGAQVKLALAGAGLGSKTPEGSIDAVNGTIGSLDTIQVKRVGSGWVKVEVHNRMDWQRSGLRIPGGDASLWDTLDALKVPGTDSTLGDVWISVVGGSQYTDQIFYWWEPMPGSR